MTDDDAHTRFASWTQTPTGWKLFGFIVLLCIIMSVIVWCALFLFVWIALNFPWDIPNPLFLADCLSRGGWACDKV